MIGAVCPLCSSTIERIFEVAIGGTPKLTRKRRECSIRVDKAAEPQGVLLDFQDSRRVRA